MRRLVPVLAAIVVLFALGSAAVAADAVGGDVVAADVADNPYADAETCGGDAQTGCEASRTPVRAASSRLLLVTLLFALFVALRATSREVGPHEDPRR